MTEPPASPAPRTTRLIPGKLSLVLPAFNEEANLGPVIDRSLAVLPLFSDDFEIIVVNDGSRDATAVIAAEYASRDGRIRVMNHQRNRGYGAALTSGFNASVGDTIMFMDADRQFDIADLRLLAPFVGDFDMVAGFRLERNDALHRRFYAEVFNISIRILFGVHLRDIDCAFKIFRGELLRGMRLSAPGALINTEIQAKARRQGATLQQVGVHHYPRLAGQSSGGNPRVILRAMYETIVLWWRMHWYQPPDTARRSPPYVLGDVVVTGVLASAGLLFASITRRLFRR